MWVPLQAPLTAALMCLSACASVVDASPATGALSAQAGQPRDATTDRNSSRTLYFSDCQPGAAPGCVSGNNANPGTQAAPKRDLTGINVNALPAGSQLLFARGGAWSNFRISLDNRNVTVAAPLIFADYGTGALPLLRTPSGTALAFGRYLSAVNRTVRFGSK